MTHAELNRLEELLHKTPMKKLRVFANDIHKECDRETLIVMIMEDEFLVQHPQEDEIDVVLHNLRGVETVSMVP